MHPQRVKESMRKYDHSLKGKERRERRKVKCKIYSKQWFIKNPDKCAEYSKRYREKDPERAKKVRKTYAQSMKGILANREKSRVRRSVFIKQKCDHNYWRSIVKEQNYKCPLCGAEYGEQIRNMALGHIFPRSKFPKLDSEVNNIIPICRKCNSKMYNMLFSDFCIKYNYPIPKRVLQYIKKNKSLLNF